MHRRKFILTSAVAMAAASLPSLLVDSYWCDCGLVQYFRQPEGHYAATHFAGQRFTYALFRQHLNLHSKPRMWQLIEIGKHRTLRPGEKAELQILLTRVAVQDVRVRESEGACGKNLTSKCP